MDLKKYEIIKGKFINLQIINEDDAEDIYYWRTSASGIYLNKPNNYSIDTQKVWIKNRPLNEVNFIIYSNDIFPKKVGMISIVDIDEQNKKAEVGRLLLDPYYLNISNPFGLEALKITYDLVFNALLFNKIYGTILSHNIGMIKLQIFLGMQEEGILKNHLLINNEYVDLHLFAIFEKGFNSKYRKKIDFLLKSFS